ncbi:hypothetical protein ACFL00_05110, partial [Pseudomonadota bacterium]
NAKLTPPAVKEKTQSGFHPKIRQTPTSVKASGWGGFQLNAKLTPPAVKEKTQSGFHPKIRQTPTSVKASGWGGFQLNAKLTPPAVKEKTQSGFHLDERSAAFLTERLSMAELETSRTACYQAVLRLQCPANFLPPGLRSFCKDPCYTRNCFRRVFSKASRL